jgi:hypothetical protein
MSRSEVCYTQIELDAKMTVSGVGLGGLDHIDLHMLRISRFDAPFQRERKFTYLEALAPRTQYRQWIDKTTYPRTYAVCPTFRDTLRIQFFSYSDSISIDIRSNEVKRVRAIR